MPINNCILGLAAGYHYGDVRPFLSSLEQTGCRAQVVLFVSDTTRDVDRIEAHGVDVIPLERPEGVEHLPYNALRYFLYLDYLRRAQTDFDRIFISDVRDVIFQRDPFDYPWPAGINCVLEDRRMTLDTCPHNAHWIRGHQGEDAVRAVTGKPISCSGTTMADHAGMVRYLETLTEQLTPFGAGERMAGYDQGVHNVLVHGDKLGRVTLSDNCGPVMTLGYTRGEPMLDSKGFVLNDRCERAFVVHQYDRKPELFKLIRARFA